MIPLIVMRYFFDFRAGDVVLVDDEGRMLDDIEAAHEEAISSLADGIKGIAVEGIPNQQITVDVRDDLGAVLEVTATFGSKILRKQ